MIQYLFVGLFCIFVPCCISLFTDTMIGPGRWLILKVQMCPNWEKYPIRLDIIRRKVNRTHDGFGGWMELDMDFDDRYAVRVDICKHVDGGCKPYQVLTDESCCHFMEKYAKKNVKECFTAYGLNETCIIPKDKHEISSYVFNYEVLPESSIYGLLGVKMHALENGQACVARALN